MIQLSQENEALALKLAAAHGLPVDVAIRRALESEARAAGLRPAANGRRRMTLRQMLALGDEMSALPLLDPRSPKEIADELNGA